MINIDLEKIKEEEARAVIRCIKDAQRVHPEWGVDDIIDMLLFREETRRVLRGAQWTKK